VSVEFERGAGQAVNGSLLGTVTDATGAVIPGANVDITEVNTDLKRSTITNENGNYVFGSLDRGVYRVEVQLPGFKKAVRDKVDVLVNSDTRVDMRLEAGSITETVEVTAASPLLETDRADVGRQIEIKQIQDMPLANNRNFQGLINLVPGTTRGYIPHSEFFDSQGALATQVNGQSRYSNNVQIEGIDNNLLTQLLNVLIPPERSTYRHAVASTLLHRRWSFGTFPLSFRVTILQTPSYYAHDTAAVRSFSLCTAYRSIDRISSNEGFFRSSIDPASGAADSEL
jgi:hypothetical protein